jgi:3',5'-cyclic AMP phosphodiesterase CpdA
VAISGDLTQRAKAAEFADARAFLDAIPFPQIVVPGNHDVPLYNVYHRFVHRLRRYRRLICNDLAPFFVDEEMAVAGVNTARSLTFKNGRINAAQMRAVRAHFDGITGGQTRVVVTHHPFDSPEGAAGQVLGGAEEAMKVLATCGVDLLLGGHFHIAHAGPTARRFRIPGYSAILVSSGTTTSTRGRGHANSFNVIRLDGNRVQVEGWEWQPKRAVFEHLSDREFQRTADGWAAAK